ncbi:MAG: hypothetical protein ACK5U0_13885, partial [Gemmatimonas sp.]
AWVMAFGVFVATFSSIYFAGPILIWIESKYPRNDDSATAMAAKAGKDLSPPSTKGGRGTERLAAR